MLIPLLFVALAGAKVSGQAGASATFMLDARTDATNESRRYCMIDSAKNEAGWVCSKWFTDAPGTEASKHYDQIVKSLDYFSKTDEGLPLATTPQKGFNLVVEYNKMRPELLRRAQAKIQELTSKKEELTKRNARNCSPEELKRPVVGGDVQLSNGRVMQSREFKVQKPAPPAASVPPTVLLQTTPAARTAQPANQPSNSSTNQPSN